MEMAALYRACQGRVRADDICHMPLTWVAVPAQSAAPAAPRDHGAQSQPVPDRSIQPPRDTLSGVLASFRAERAVTARFALHAPWALQSRGVEGVLIRMCTGAPYWLTVRGEAPVRLAPRDIALLPHGGAHDIASDPALVPRPIAGLIQAHTVGAHGDHPIVFTHGEGGPATQLYSLHLWMPGRGMSAMLRALPALVVLRAHATPGNGALALALESLVDETIAQQPGWKLAAARMADLLLVQLLRAHLATTPQAQEGTGVGWLRGMDDDRIAQALVALHEHPARPWTVDALAKTAGLSRTVFAERFRALVGATPMGYLLSFRMTLAAEMLRQRRRGLAQVAAAVGYGSDKAFARAFTRWAGETPAAWVRRNGAPS